MAALYWFPIVGYISTSRNHHLIALEKLKRVQAKRQALYPARKLKIYGSDQVQECGDNSDPVTSASFKLL